MQLDQQIDMLRQEIAVMARKAEGIFDRALKAMETRNDDLVIEVLDLDPELNAYEIKMDALCMRILALSEPYAVDFRYVYSVSKTTRDLERIGDESKTIAKWSRKLPGPPSQELIRLGQKAKEALAVAVDSLLKMDAVQANRVLDLEIDVDAIEDDILKSATDVPQAFIAKAMERVGDMATNIAENVIFCVKAQDIRHSEGQIA